MARRGLEARFERGRRVTDAAALECVIEGLGAVSKDLCDALEAAGRPTSALVSGAVSARRDPLLGLVGTHPVLTDAGAAAIEQAFRLLRHPSPCWRPPCHSRKAGALLWPSVPAGLLR